MITWRTYQRYKKANKTVESMHAIIDSLTADYVDRLGSEERISRKKQD